MDISLRTRPPSAPRSAPIDRFGVVGAALLALLLVLMIVPEGFDYSLLSTGVNPESGSALSRALWLALFVGGVLLAMWRSSLFRLTLGRMNVFLLAFVCLAVASIAWSIEPIVTLRRDFRMLTIFIVCVAFTLAGWHARRLQNVVRPILTALLLGSLVFGAVEPTLAIHQEKSAELIGAWRGLTNHKNSLGALAGVTLLFWLHAWTAREVRALKAIAGGLVAALCLWLSRSATSVIATMFAAASLVLLTQWPRALQHYLKYAVALVIVALTIYSLTMLRLIPGQSVLLSPLAAVMGSKDLTFTGRSEIWTLITEHIAQNPLLGTGYGAYWTGPTNTQSPSYEFIVHMNGFYPGTAHNGYLEVANDLGWIGLLVLFGYMAQQIRDTLRLFVVDRPQAALYLTLFMHQLVANLSESHWLSVQSVQFVIMTLMTAALARQAMELRMQLSILRHHAMTGRSMNLEAPAWNLKGRRA